MSKDNRLLKAAFKIGNTEVEKIGDFLGFELYQYDDDSDYEGEIITYFVKGGIVQGETRTQHSGGQESSSSAVVSFKTEK